MRTSWPGEWSDGQTAALHAVEARFDGGGLSIRDADGRELVRWSADSIVVEGTPSRDAVELRSREMPEASLHLEGPGLREDLAAIGVRSRGLPEGDARRTIVGLALMAGIVGVVGLVWISVTPVSRAIAGAIPLEYERALHGRIDEALAEHMCEGDGAREVMDGLVVRLAGEAHGLPPVQVMNLAMPNAFALPGGGIVFTRGLIETAASPDEVAGVLAHEIQHVEQRHVMTAFVRGALLSSLWAVTVGDYAGLLVIDPTTAFQIATQRFSREDEASADDGAFEMLDRAGIRRDGIAEFFERLAEQEGDVPEWLSTHPASGRRARAARESGTTEGAVAPALDEAAWATLRGACAESDAPEAELQDLLFP